MGHFEREKKTSTIIDLGHSITFRLLFFQVIVG